MLGIGLAASSGQIFPHAGNSSSTAIHSCVNKTSFIDSVVGINGSCASNETPTHRDISGLMGEKGERGTHGEKGEKGAAGEKGATGATGAKGATGATGARGTTGATGATGTEGQRGSIGMTGSTGATGAAGAKGADGISGISSVGADGKSAYKIAVANGFKGSELDWLASLEGDKGKDGKSAFQLVQDTGYTGKLVNWLASLKGEKGEQGNPGISDPTGSTGLPGPQGPKGTDGKDGSNGIDGKSAFQLALDEGYTGKLMDWLASLKGEKGDSGTSVSTGGVVGPPGPEGPKGADGKDGSNGVNGKSAYELAVDNGYAGKLADWLASLEGEKGDPGTNSSTGVAGLPGPQGPKGDTGPQGPAGTNPIEAPSPCLASDLQGNWSLNSNTKIVFDATNEVSFIMSPAIPAIDQLDGSQQAPPLTSNSSTTDGVTMDNDCTFTFTVVTPAVYYTADGQNGSNWSTHARLVTYSGALAADSNTLSLNVNKAVYDTAVTKNFNGINNADTFRAAQFIAPGDGDAFSGIAIRLP